jgi:uncharacterized phage protein gp47/JayE
MVELDGKQYVVKSVDENVTDLITSINTYCTANNIKNSKDEVVQIVATPGNPLYMLLYGVAFLINIVQRLVYSLGCSLSPQASSEAQLLNLAAMAGIQRGSASKTTLRVLVRAAIETESMYTGDGTLVIESSNSISYQGVKYYPALYPSITLKTGETAYLTFIADTEGSFTVTEGSITGFDSTLENLASFTQYASIPGQAEESIASLRERLQKRQYSGTTLDDCIDAIRSLEGVTTASVVFNPTVTETYSIGSAGFELPPRYAMIFVQGYNSSIGEVFFQHFCAPTINVNSDGSYDYRNIPSSRVLEVQKYTSPSNQTFPVLILAPAQIPVYLKIYLATKLSTAQVTTLKQVVVSSIATSLTMGSSITSSQILNALKNYDVYQVLGTELSSDGVTYSYTVYPKEDEIWSINVNNITVIMPKEE